MSYSNNNNNESQPINVDSQPQPQLPPQQQQQQQPQPILLTPAQFHSAINAFRGEDPLSPDLTPFFPILELVSRSGNCSGYDWSDIQFLLRLRYEQVYNAFVLRTGEAPAIDGESSTIRSERNINCLLSFHSPPFTLQRLSELLYHDSELYYNTTAKFLLAISKCVCGISGEILDEEGIINSINNSNNNSNNNNNNNNQQHYQPWTTREPEDAIINSINAAAAAAGAGTDSISTVFPRSSVTNQSTGAAGGGVTLQQLISTTSPVDHLPIATTAIPISLSAAPAAAAYSNNIQNDSNSQHTESKSQSHSSVIQSESESATAMDSD